LRFGCLHRLCAELDQQPAFALRQQSDAFRIDSLTARVVREQVIETFETDRSVGEDFWNVVSALIDVRITNDEQYAVRRAFDQAAVCFENCNACAFRADQRARPESRFQAEDSSGCNRRRDAGYREISSE